MRSLDRIRAVAALWLVVWFSIGVLNAPEVLAGASEPGSDGEGTPPSPVHSAPHSAPAGDAPDPPLGEESEDEFDFELEDQLAGFPDPWEESNRGVLGFNNLFDRYLLDPVTAAYGFLFPRPVKVALRRVFTNLNEPSTAVNDMIQLEWMDALRSGTRFVVNSSVGLGGLFDPAARWGLELHQSDFGQTLALAGTPSGPYVVFPFAGPNTVRGGAGFVVDAFMRPATYLTYLLGPIPWIFLHGGSGMTTREAHLEELEALRETSIDYYAALRNAYYQNRVAQIWRRREHRR
jgi:phospholipid-binding lipoprotein MlaA